MTTPDAATQSEFPITSTIDRIAFEQRHLLRPWRVERIVQEWNGRRWVVIERKLVRRGF